MSKPVKAFVRALHEHAQARRVAGASALQSLSEQQKELAQVCSTVEFWVNFSNYADAELRAAAKLLRAAQKLLEKSLNSKRASQVTRNVIP